ncbi:butyrate--CoA ligase AAE11, peroxisomal-like, partial [Momordica charantia]|uniref:Butyrate--CoA ligase AAE11, peroxisomal-like n=1 Tax=Momordica charantia TaxID=3673 RepID=A0A6J1CJE5_MOMCH
MESLSKCDSNFCALTPISFLRRASASYADRTSVIYERTRFTWRNTFQRCSRLASSLRSLNVSKNDVVSVIAPNVPALYEMHFAVPMAGAVLNTINTRLDVKNIAVILRHSEAKVLFVDYQYIPQAKDALRLLVAESTAYDIYRNINMHHVTHMCCAPIVFRIILEAESADRRRVGSPVNVLTGGAPPPAPLLEKMEALGFHITHAYGLTEATGPALVCEWQHKWNSLPSDQQAKLKARQGIGILTLADVDVKNLETMESVPHDGRTAGE